MRGKVALLGVALALALQTGCGGAQGVQSVGAGAYALTPADIGARVHRRVNQLRASYGLRALSWESELLPIARDHSADMMRRNYFAHHSPEGHSFKHRYQAGGYRCEAPIDERRYLTGGENLALSHRFTGTRVYSDGRRVPYGKRTAEQIAERVVTGWFNSPGHRRNMLNPHWRKEAIGVVIGVDGRIWVTQNFC